MNVFARYNPQATYYSADRDQLNTYDTEIDTYNTALKAYQEQAGKYQKEVDAFNETVNSYNTDLDNWKKSADDYNKAIKKWNESARTTPFKDMDYYVEHPGEWSRNPPEFQPTMEAPVAPEELGYTGEDVDQFVQEAQGRAARRAATSATAASLASSPEGIVATEVGGTRPEVSLSGFGFEEGGVVPPPTPTAEDLARAAALSDDTGQGIGYYIPPELKKLGKAALGVASAVDPAQGIMRGMAASGRAFDSDLPADERREAAIEAALETLAPAGMIGIGAAAKQPAKAVLMDILTPTGATKDIAEDTLGDPSRRKFLKGAAATAATAAIAPDAIGEIAEVAKKATKTAAKTSINPVDMFSQNIKLMRREMDEAYDAADEIYENMETGGLSPNLQDAYDEQIANAEKMHQDLDATTEMEMRELFTDIGPAELADAADESLEDLSQALTDFRNYTDEEYINEMVDLADEIKKRGLIDVKNEEGVPQYPYARAVVDDVADHLSGDKTSKDIFGVYNPPTGSQMTDDRGSMGVEDVFRMDQENRKREMMREQLLAEYNRAMEQGLDDAEIDARIATKRRILEQEYGIPFSFADGGVVQRYQEGGMVNTPFADPIKMASPMPAAGPAMTRAIGEDGSGNFPIASVSTMAMGEDGSSPMPQQLQTLGPPQQGVGGLFEMQQNQFQNAMQNVTNNPLDVYQGYLGKKYGAPQMEQFQGKVDEFMGLVRQAEEAHFGGGGIGPYASMVGGGGGQIGSGSLPAPVGAMTQAMGEDGGGGASVGSFASMNNIMGAGNLMSTAAMGEG
jgi:hypothetical protein